MVLKKKVANSIELNTKKIVSDAILDVSFGNEKDANVLVYIVDEKGLKMALKSTYGKALQAEIDFNEFKPETGQVANVGIVNKQKVVFVGFGKSEKDKQ